MALVRIFENAVPEGADLVKDRGWFSSIVSMTLISYVDDLLRQDYLVKRS